MCTILRALQYTCSTLTVHSFFITSNRPEQHKVSCCCSGKLGGPVWIVSLLSSWWFSLVLQASWAVSLKECLALLLFWPLYFKVCSFAPSSTSPWWSPGPASSCCCSGILSCVPEGMPCDDLILTPTHPLLDDQECQTPEKTQQMLYTLKSLPYPASCPAQLSHCVVVQLSTASDVSS
jgi:hypothetical protein